MYSSAGIEDTACRYSALMVLSFATAAFRQAHHAKHGIAPEGNYDGPVKIPVKDQPAAEYAKAVPAPAAAVEAVYEAPLAEEELP